MEIKNDRLRQDLEDFENMSHKELLQKKLECQNIRILINHELSLAEAEGRTNTEWYRKATAAYKVNGLKVSAIDGLIGLMGNKNAFYREFHSQVKKFLDKSDFDLLEKETNKRINKEMS